MTRPRHSFALRLPPAPPGRRIGLLGGSFNPAHDGHRQISDIARKRLRLEQIWWIVSPGNPLKSGADLAPLATRQQQARELAGSPRITVTDFEAQLPTRFTVDTLAFLVRRHPHVRFIWLMGADNLVQMPRWRDWRRIFALMPVAVVDRPSWHLKARSSRAAQMFKRVEVRPAETSRLFDGTRPRWMFLNGPLSPLSSTALRSAAQRSQ